MKIRKVSLILVLMLLMLSSSVVHAAGVGFYVSAGAGTADWDSASDYYNYYTDNSYLTNRQFKGDTSHLSAGLSFDTHLGGDGLFNYHLNVGYERFTTKDLIVQAEFSSDLSMFTTTAPDPIKSDADLRGFVMSHAFGFGGELAPGTRLWLGPEVRLQWAKGSPDKAPDVDVKMFGVGIGPAVGFNLNFKGGLTMVFKAGYQFMTLAADVDGYTPARDYVNQSFDVDEKFFYFNLELLARTSRDR